MAENFIFTLNAVLPIFIMIALGYFFKYIKLINDEFISTANKFVYVAALTSYLFRSTAVTNFHEIIDIKFIIFIESNHIKYIKLYCLNIFRENKVR